MLFHKLASHFSYFPPKFKMLSVEMETWAASPDHETGKFGDLIRGPVYQLHLALPNLVSFRVLPPRSKSWRSERSVHFGSEILIADGAQKYEQHWMAEEACLEACPPTLIELCLRSGHLAYLDPTIMLREEQRPFRRDEHHLLSGPGRFVYSRFNAFLGAAGRQRLSVDRRTNFPMALSLTTVRDDQQIMKIVFSNWQLHHDVDVEVFKLPVPRAHVGIERFGQIRELVFPMIAEAIDVPPNEVTRWYNIGESVGKLPPVDRADPENPVVRQLATLMLRIKTELARLGEPTREQLREQEAFFGELNAGKLNAGQLLEWLSIYEAECDGSPDE